MPTPHRLTGCALATLLLAVASPSAARAQEAQSAPSASTSGVASFSGASSAPAPESTPAPPPVADLPPAGEPAPAMHGDLAAPESAGASTTGAVRTYSSARAEGDAPPARLPRSASLYLASTRTRISIPRYSVEQVSRSILRLRIAAFTRASMPPLSANPPRAAEGSDADGSPDAAADGHAPADASAPAPLAATPVD